jgi:nitrate/nitrite transporter NarK
MASGGAMLGGAFIAASYASQIWHLYLLQGVLVGIGVGCLYVPSLPVISQWFDRRRSLANGISAAGSGIGGSVFSFAIGAMIDNLSLAWSVRIIGISTLFMNTLATAFIRDRNADTQPKQRPFDRELLCRVKVLLLLAWSFFSTPGYITLLYSLSEFALSIGLSRDRATQMTATLNAGTAIVRPFISIASDRFGRFEIAAGLTFLCGLCYMDSRFLVWSHHTFRPHHWGDPRRFFGW